MNTLDERLKKIKKIISEQSFLSNRGNSNEVGYYIFDYPAEEELKVRKYIYSLVKDNKENDDNYNLKVYDLYDIMIDLIEEEHLLESCIQMEKENGMDYLISAIYDLLQMDNDFNYFRNYIETHTPDNSVVFITGIGKIFPFIRSHGILNKLHLVFNRAPVVLFYPGKYDGQSLVLFSKFKDENYYRAFPLII